MPRSYAAYIATAMMLYVAGVDVEGFGVVGALSKQAGVFLILSLGLYYLLRRRTWEYGYFDRRVALIFLVFIVYGFVSLYWTFSSPATVTATFAWLYIASLCVVLSGLKDEDCFEVFLNVVFVFCLAGVARIFIGVDAFVVNQGVERFQGVFFGPHALAAPTALGMIILVSGVVRQRVAVRLLYFLVIGLSLYFTYSRQAFLAALVGMFLTLLLKVGSVVRTRTIIVLILSAVAFGVVAELKGGVSQDVIARGEGDDVTTLTGRTLIWRAAAELIGEKPFFGYGFGAGGAALEDYYAAGVAGWRTFNVHNGFLQAQLDLGLVGMTLFLLLFGYFVRATFFSRDYLRIGLAGAVLLITMVERGAYGLGGLVVTLFVFFAFRQPRNLYMRGEFGDG